MERRRFKWIMMLSFVAGMVGLAGCSDESKEVGTGEVDFEITDAPIDDANISGVFVTVTDLKVNGQSVSGFQKQTINLKAYQEGNTKLLATGQFAAKSSNNLAMVLDLDSDANGNAPGCYVLTTDGTRHKLRTTATGTLNVAAGSGWAISNEAKNRIVIDFDLRKAIRYTNDAAAPYAFVSDNNLGASVRAVAGNRSGTIRGTYQEESSVDAEKIIVYAYKKGSFNASVETQPQTEDNIYFRNAVASAEVKGTLSGREYTLAFLEEGDYELHFVAYNKDVSTGRYSFSGRLQSQTTVDGQVGEFVRVRAGASVTITSTIKGVI